MTYLLNTTAHRGSFKTALPSDAHRLDWTCGTCGSHESLAASAAHALIEAGWTPYREDATTSSWACPDCAEALSTASF